MNKSAQIKKCYNCKLDKKYPEFYKNKTKVDGLSDMCRECCIEYYNSHREYFADRRKDAKDNPEFVNTPQLWYFNGLKRKRKNFYITYQEILDANHCKNCCYCGVELKFTKKYEQASGNQNASLDRIDSSKGYKVGNIQWTCWDCNHLKNNLNQDKFLHLCNLIAKQHPEQ